MKNLSTLYNKILAAKRANPQADISKWEGEIDQLTVSHQLCGLILNIDEVGILEEMV